MTKTDVLVETGSFRVDPRRMLEKLKLYQLPDAASATMMLVRCGVASGAKLVDIRILSGLLEARFDGRPFGRSDLRHPFSALFEPDSAPRRRYAAVAMLRLLRSQPKWVALVSGPPSKRYALLLASIDKQEVSPVSGSSESRTVLRAEWGFWRNLRSRRFRPEPRGFDKLCATCPASIRVNGRSWFSPAWRRLRGFPFRGESVRGSLELPENPQGGHSRLKAYLHGVEAGRLHTTLLPLKLNAVVDAPDWPLNASMTGIVKNERFSSVLARLEPHIRRFLLAMIREQKGRENTIGRLLLERKESRDAGRDSYPVRDEASGWTGGSLLQAMTDSRRTLWLRSACFALRGLVSRRKGRGEASLKAALDALWSAPLFWDVRGRPLSLAELERTARGGMVRYSDVPWPGYDESSRVVWTVWGRTDITWLSRLTNAPTRQATPPANS
ncbi:MAG: hypothetical protein ABII00_12685 [Elusimicrobiota bacterium]